MHIDVSAKCFPHAMPVTADSICEYVVLTSRASVFLPEQIVVI